MYILNQITVTLLAILGGWDDVIAQSGNRLSVHFGNKAGPECFPVLFHSSQSVGVAHIMWRVCFGRGAGVDTQGFSVQLSCARSRFTATLLEKDCFLVTA